jgi:hypothetical protein
VLLGARLLRTDQHEVEEHDHQDDGRDAHQLGLQATGHIVSKKISI